MGNIDLQKLLVKDSYQVFLVASPASLPVSFGIHPWFVLNKKGDISRFEIVWQKNLGEPSWGYLYKNLYAPVEGLPVLFFFQEFYWKSRMLGVVEGPLAEKMIDFIEKSPSVYQYCYTYSLLGPNSNTYAQWVIDHFPESNFSLPSNAFGKNFKIYE